MYRYAIAYNRDHVATVVWAGETNYPPPSEVASAAWQGCQGRGCDANSVRYFSADEAKRYDMQRELHDAIERYQQEH